MSEEALLVRIRGRLRSRIAVYLCSSPGIQTNDAIEGRFSPKVEQEPDLETRCPQVAEELCAADLGPLVIALHFDDEPIVHDHVEPLLCYCLAFVESVTDTSRATRCPSATSSRSSAAL